jgi:hypothetical protein
LPETDAFVANETPKDKAKHHVKVRRATIVDRDTIEHVDAALRIASRAPRARAIRLTGVGTP